MQIQEIDKYTYKVPFKVGDIFWTFRKDYRNFWRDVPYNNIEAYLEPIEIKIKNVQFFFEENQLTTSFISESVIINVGFEEDNKWYFTDIRSLFNNKEEAINYINTRKLEILKSLKAQKQMVIQGRAKKERTTLYEFSKQNHKLKLKNFNNMINAVEVIDN